MCDLINGWQSPVDVLYAKLHKIHCRPRLKLALPELCSRGFPGCYREDQLGGTALDASALPNMWATKGCSHTGTVERTGTLERLLLRQLLGGTHWVGVIENRVHPPGSEELAGGSRYQVEST